MPECRLGAFGSSFSPCGEVGAGPPSPLDGIEAGFLHLLPIRFYGVLEALVLLAVADVESHLHTDSEDHDPKRQSPHQSSSLLVHIDPPSAKLRPVKGTECQLGEQPVVRSRGPAPCSQLPVASASLGQYNLLMKVHLVDGTYELFRHYYALPNEINDEGQEVAATAGVVGSVLSMLENSATHIAVATDHVIASFRNDLWPEYKDSSGIEPELLSQFGLLEDALCGLGVVVWAMVEHEADDALGAGAEMAAADERVEQVLLCTPDKDLSQCVVGNRVVQLDRRKREIRNEEGVIRKFGVAPLSIPDYLGLMGDTSDGYPGLPGWGAKSSSTVLACYHHIEEIPDSAEHWDVPVRGAAKLANTLAQNRDLALLFRRIATVDVRAPVSASVDELKWSGPIDGFEEICGRIMTPGLAGRAERHAMKQ